MDLVIPREQFRALVIEREQLKASRSQLFNPDNAFYIAYEAARQAGCDRVDGPAPAKSRKRKLTKACGVCDGCQRTHEQWQAVADMVWGHYKAAIEHVEAQLRALCTAGLRPQPGDLEIVLATRDGGEYHTVGLGANTYAKAAAEMVADAARYHHVPVEVRRVSERTVRRGPGVWDSSTYSKFEVVAKLADDLDREILQYCPRASLVEQVRSCWARGVNPRVYIPYLPHGFEAQHGLDFFGGRKEA